MLGNVAPLWISMLAAMKLGLVVIPATPQLAGADIDDRAGAGRARGFVIADGADAGQVRRLAARGAVRIAVGVPPPGWRGITPRLPRAKRAFRAGTVRRLADDPMLLYFTSGTTTRPKLVEHTQATTPWAI